MAYDHLRRFQPESGERELTQWLMFIVGTVNQSLKREPAQWLMFIFDTFNQSLENVSLHSGLCSSPALSPESGERELTQWLIFTFGTCQPEFEA